MKQQRLKKCKLLLERFKGASQVPIVFSDEKLFLLEKPVNRQNDRQIAPVGSSAKGLLKSVPRVSHPAGVMVWGGICATGKTPLIFIEKGVKINAPVYQNEVLVKVLHPWAQKQFGKRKWYLQQDWAPAHGAETQFSCVSVFFLIFSRKMTGRLTLLI